MAGPGVRWARDVRRSARELVRDLAPWGGAPLPRWQRGPGLLPHVAIAWVAAGCGMWAGWLVAAADPGLPLLTAALLGIAQGAPLVLCLVRPMAGLWVALVVGVVVSEVARVDATSAVWAAPSLVVQLIVLGLVGARTPAPVSVVLWLLTLLTGAVLVQRMPAGYDRADQVEMALFAAVILVAAGAVRGRQEARQALVIEVWRVEVERARRAVSQERTRIARELHDVLAHHMSVIAIQAEAAPYRVPNPPAELAAGFATIGEHARGALDELRRVLGVLRAETDGADSGPQPALRDIPTLVAGARDGGLDVRTSTTGTPRRLPAGLEVSAFRITQEALSNAMRHAPGSAVLVEVDHGRHALRLRIGNGPPAATAFGPDRPEHQPTQPPEHGPLGADSTMPSGHGLVGMRERAAMLGADLTASATADGGFLVDVRFPIDVTSPLKEGPRP